MFCSCFRACRMTSVSITVGLWQGILRADVDSIQTYSDALGVGKLYGLFACMLTARSWKAVTRGVDKLSFTNAEVNYLNIFLSHCRLFILSPVYGHYSNFLCSDVFLFLTLQQYFNRQTFLMQTFYSVA